MSTAHFRITYDGPALATHEMDVRELAPALIALGELLEAANRTINGPNVRVGANVKGSFKTGSFGVDFSVVTAPLKVLADLLTSKEITAAATLLALIGFSGRDAAKGLMSVLRWLKGRAVVRIEERDQVAVIHTTDDSLEVELLVAKLLRDAAVRKSLEAVVVKPLRTAGIESFGCGSDDAFTQVVMLSEVEWFTAPQPIDTPLLSASSQALLVVESAVFKEGNKWRFTDGQSSFHAEIADTDFSNRMLSGQERFGRGDVLVVELEKRQYASDGVLRAEYRVTKVLEHREPLQASLL